MRARWLVLAGICVWSSLARCIAAVLGDDGEAGSETRQANVRISVEQVKFPAAETIGLLGTSYLVALPGPEGFFVGPGVYGAITGHRGGFFTFGAETSWRRRLVGSFGVEAGLYAGAGGGSGAPQGGGLMLRPHIDLWWDLVDYSLGVSLSKVKFPNGQINSTQFGLVLDKSTDFVFVPPDRIGTNAGSAAGAGRTGVGFDRALIVASMYRSRPGTTLSDGSEAPRTIALLGIRAERSLGPHAYWGLEASGAAQTGVAGFAEYLGEVGYEFELSPGLLTVGARLSLGMAGGGGIQTGGGLLGKATLHGGARVTDAIDISIEAGLVDAPRGSFRATSVAAVLAWRFDRVQRTGAPDQAVRTDVSVGLEQVRAPRRDGSERGFVSNVLQIDRFVGRNLYLSGQIHSALAGGAGGYSEALVGLGWLQPISPRYGVGAEFLLGASGGGGVVSHGSVVKPEAYARVQLTPAIGLRISGGRERALRGPFDSNVVSVLVSAGYGS